MLVGSLKKEGYVAHRGRLTAHPPLTLPPNASTWYMAMPLVNTAGSPQEEAAHLNWEWRYPVRVLYKLV